MGKVTIKFWNIEQGCYSEMPSWYYFIDKNGDVFCEGDCGMEDQLHIAPHYFKDGERIA